MFKKTGAGAGVRAAVTLALGVSAAAVAAPAFAQDSDDEIVVTATRRDQALQDVPIAVTPVTADMIENSGIRDVQDLTSVAPSLQFNVSEFGIVRHRASARRRHAGLEPGS